MQFNALYTTAPDYDQVFVIEDDSGTRLGQCGVGFAAQIEDQPVAFDIWLQPDGAEHPAVTFLLTEYALNDDGIYHTLNESGAEVERLREGMTVTLHKEGLRLEATITALDYGRDTIDVFARPTILERLLGRERQPATILTPKDYITRLAATLTIG